MTAEPQLQTYKRVEIYSLVKNEDGSISRVPKCLCELCRVNHFLCPRYGGTGSAKSEAVLDLVVAIIEDRIIELKRWIKVAEINQDVTRKSELLPVLGENQALLAQIQELRQQQERERG